MLRTLVVLVTLLPFASCVDWAVVVAGSNEYYNYRHQADVCHAYQILHANGFPDDNIIMMYYDDIANADENPVKGELINQPDGPNVYAGCKKDYTGDTVTPQNFLKVLSGESMAGIGSGRSVQSGPDDNIFVFFSDHGATGLLAFPSDELHATQLNKTITKMYNEKKYKQMLIYIEACEAGSMFNNVLSDSVNVLAVTASDPNHSSYAIYYDDKRGTYLGDVFSVYWMQDSEVNEHTETIGAQIATVTTETNTSAVCTYGNVAFESESLATFQSFGSAAMAVNPNQKPLPLGDVADSRDVEMMVLRRRLENADAQSRPRIAAQLNAAMERREKHDRRIQQIAAAASSIVGGHIDFLGVSARDDDICHPSSSAIADHECLQEMVQTFKKACGKFDDYSLKHVKVLNAFCNNKISPAQLSDVMVRVCHE